MLEVFEQQTTSDENVIESLMGQRKSKYLDIEIHSRERDERERENFRLNRTYRYHINAH